MRAGLRSFLFVSDDTDDQRYLALYLSNQSVAMAIFRLDGCGHHAVRAPKESGTIYSILEEMIQHDATSAEMSKLLVSAELNHEILSAHRI